MRIRARMGKEREAANRSKLFGKADRNNGNSIQTNTNLFLLPNEGLMEVKYLSREEKLSYREDPMKQQQGAVEKECGG